MEVSGGFVMKKYGKRLAYEDNNGCIECFFSKGSVFIDIISDEIIRFYDLQGHEERPSQAIEGLKKKQGHYHVEDHDERLDIFTDSLIIEIRDDFMTTIKDHSGLILCEDYQGERQHRSTLDEDDQSLMMQEGHQFVEESKVKNIQVFKKADVKDCFYGLGDKTGVLNKRSYYYKNWNTDNPAPHTDNFEALYKSIPFLIVLKEKGVYGLFFDNTHRTYFDLAKESEDYYWFGSDRGDMNYYFIHGETMKDVVGNYTYLTGRTPLPQRWTLGYMQSRWGYKNERDIQMIARHMREHDFPCDAIHLDIDYMDAYKIFTINKQRYPDLHRLQIDLKKEGIRLVTIIDPGIKIEKGYEIYEEGIKNNYFVKDRNGKVYENAVWPGDSVYPDFGRQEVRDWWGKHLQVLTDQGIAGIWNDMNEPASFKGELPDDVVFYDEERKTDHEEMHNVYGHLMCKATYEGLKNLTHQRPFVITRACYAGSQKYTTGWTGDNHSIWSHLALAIPQMCNLGLSGLSFVGTDIGGFGSDTTPELMARWIQVGAFSPLCRNHSGMGTRFQEPWEFPESIQSIYRQALSLRYKLIPYFYDLFHEEEETGLPIMRPLVLNYEEDQEARNINDAFMIGDALLVSPVITQGATKKLVYLPQGEWYEYGTSIRYSGNQYMIANATLDTCPLYVKAGTILPVATAALSIREQENLILEIYPGKGRYVHYQDNGEDFAYQEGKYNTYLITLDHYHLHLSLLHHDYPLYKKLIVHIEGTDYVLDMKEEMDINL